MRRIEIFNSILKIQRTLEETQIHKYFSATPQITGPETIAEDYQKITLLFSALNEEDRKILERFYLLELSSPKVWGRIFAATIMANDGTMAKEFQSIRNGLYYFKEYIPLILHLFSQGNVDAEGIRNAIKTYALQIQQENIITLILPEQDGQCMRPERLVKALESITKLYEIAAILGGSSPNNLEILAMDSGRDKAVDLRGEPVTINAVKAIILELWDISVFFRERKMSEGIDWVLRTLKAYEQIVHQEQSEMIGPEQAHILKAGLVEAANSYLATGAVLPEIEQLPGYDRNIALLFERKLLLRPTEEPTHTYTSSEPDETVAEQNATDSNNVYYTDDQILFNQFIEAELKKSRFKRKLEGWNDGL